MTDTIIATRYIEGPGPMLRVSTFPLQMLVTASSDRSSYTLHLTREKALSLADAIRECVELMTQEEVAA